MLMHRQQQVFFHCCLTTACLQRSGTARTETTLPERTNDYTSGYAAAVVELGKELQLPVVDLWTSMQAQRDWQTQLLCDGLHFTPAGNRFVYQQLQPSINKAYPKLRYAVHCCVVHTSYCRICQCMLFVCCMLCSTLPAEFQLLTEVSSKYAMLARLATMLYLSFCVILVCLDMGQ